MLLSARRPCKQPSSPQCAPCSIAYFLRDRQCCHGELMHLSGKRCKELCTHPQFLSTASIAAWQRTGSDGGASGDWARASSTLSPLSPNSSSPQRSTTTLCSVPPPAVPTTSTILRLPTSKSVQSAVKTFRSEAESSLTSSCWHPPTRAQTQHVSGRGVESPLSSGRTASRWSLGPSWPLRECPRRRAPLRSSRLRNKGLPV